ncbi:MAG: nucleoside recognition domain-containing protein [Bacteroidota bacterium]|nr:nucleoside recognition domain-containing protein [Bacteroidota bacterium]
MVLNYIWIFFFLIAFAIALVKLIVFGDMQIFPAIIQSTFDMAKTGFEISIGLTGILTLWLGLMRVGEAGGIVKILSKIVGPFFARLFPELGKDHPATGSIILNLAANMLGLDNAATPMGLKAMKEMQATNPHKDTASNAQIMFLTLNASGLTLIPITVMMYRAQMGAADPSDIFVPIMMATFFSTLIGLISVSIYQRINLFDKVIMAYLGGLFAIIIGVLYYFSTLNRDQITVVSKLVSNVIIFSVIVSFILLALRKKVNVYETFIEGAKEGFGVAVKIIPYLVAILVAIAVFRASGALDILVKGVRWIFMLCGCNTDFVDALPVAFMKPLSGNGARGMMIETMKNFGADSFAGKLACTLQGAADTTFYIVALYFGSVGITKTRYALVCGLLADFAGAVAAIFICYMFFHK